MVQPTRVCWLNGRPAGRGRYVLYWMQQAQRAWGNHALAYAVGRADELGVPLKVVFGLTDRYPEANLRHYRFMLEGLRETAAELARRGIDFSLKRGQPPAVALAASERAAMVVCDRGYLLHQRRWRDELADRCAVSVVEVESDVVVPVEEASAKAEYAARTIRPKILSKLGQYLTPLEERSPRRAMNKVEAVDVKATLASLKVDRSVGASRRFVGGTPQARERLRRFIGQGLGRYAQGRSEPAAGIASGLSPYLHFGQISPVEIALAIRGADAAEADRAAFLEELIVRRELACNFVAHTPEYWTYGAMPAWARRSLKSHGRDGRARVYTREELEAAQTDDPYWNAAMREMVQSGYMHNHMRMYWGKRIIGWKRRPEEAFADMLYLNNKYFLDGRDPNSYAGVGWCFGLHDRPWKQRPVFGQIRYMNAAGLERKFDMDAYVRFVEGLERAEA